jgi:dTDP-4-amino-4,6-dideoxygalactose transaminase
LHLALRVLGIKAGDVVAASSFTFIASVAPITYLGATPLLIDSEARSWNLDPNLFEEACKRERIKALVVTHLYGQCADLDAITAICDRYGVVLIEDAAESLGAKWQGRQSGTFGRFGVYSFNGNKIITTSGGGMLVGQDAKEMAHATKLSTQAREPVLHYEHHEIGYNYRLSNVLGAIGRGQMQVLADRVAKKRAIFERYYQALGDLPVSFMPELPGSEGNRWLTTLLIDPQSGVTPAQVCQALEKGAIESRPLWKPMHCQEAFKDVPRRANGVSERLFNEGVCLPSGTAMDGGDFDRVVQAFRACFRV